MRHFGTYHWKRGRGWARITALSGQNRWGLGVALERRGTPGIEIELAVVAIVIELNR